MIDVKAYDRRIGAIEMPKWMYTVLKTVLTILGIMFCAVCFQISRDWDMAAWNGWKVIDIFILAAALMWGGEKLVEKSRDSIIKSVAGSVLVIAPFGFVLGAIMATYNVGDMMRVFTLAVLFAIIMGVASMFMPKDMSRISLPIGALILVALGLWNGSLTLVDWICWAVLGFSLLVVAVVMMEMERHYTVRIAIAGLSAAFVIMVKGVLLVLSSIWTARRRHR